jgi:hypothetical protein
MSDAFLLWHEDHDITIEQHRNNQEIEILGVKYLAVDALINPDHRFIVSIEHGPAWHPKYEHPHLRLCFFGTTSSSENQEPAERSVYIPIVNLFKAGYHIRIC